MKRVCRWVFPVSLVFLLPTSSWAGVVTVAHRGYSYAAPENTVAAIDAAAGITWGVEFDVRQTFDGHLVLMHDESVNRTTDGTGNVNARTFDYIRSLDAGYKFSPEFAGEQVPTLLEAVDAALAGGLVPCIEVKAGDAWRYNSQLAPYQDQIEIHSFSSTFLQQLNFFNSGYTLVLLGGGDLGDALSSMPACVDKVSWNYDGLTADDIAAARATGRDVYAWTVDSASTMISRSRMGVTGIVSNRIELAVDTLDFLPGDANIDGAVDADDAAILGDYWQESYGAWALGDFNGDREINAADASILAANWGSFSGESTPAPEPGFLVLWLALGLTVLTARKSLG